MIERVRAGAAAGGCVDDVSPAVTVVSVDDIVSVVLPAIAVSVALPVIAVSPMAVSVKPVSVRPVELEDEVELGVAVPAKLPAAGGADSGGVLTGAAGAGTIATVGGAGVGTGADFVTTGWLGFVDVVVRAAFCGVADVARRAVARELAPECDDDVDRVEEPVEAFRGVAEDAVARDSLVALAVVLRAVVVREDGVVVREEVTVRDTGAAPTAARRSAPIRARNCRDSAAGYSRCPDASVQMLLRTASA